MATTVVGIAQRPLSRSAWLGGLVFVTALATWARLTGWREIFVAGRVLTRDPDADYHLLRIAKTAVSFPHAPVIDPHLNWPEGGACPWAPGFDVLGALFARVLGANDPHEVERVVAFYPVVLGVALVWAVVALTRRLLPRGAAADLAALTAGALMAVLPRAVMASSLGRVDHHVFEALAHVLLGSWALGAVRAATKRRSPGPGFELHGAAVVLLAGSGFSGSILYAALAGALVCGARLVAPAQQNAAAPLLVGSGAPAFGLAAVGLALISAPAVAEHGRPFDFRLASLLQPTLHGLLAFGCAAASAVARRNLGATAPHSRLLRRGSLLAVTAAVATLLLWPWLGDGLWHGLHDWLATRDPWLASIDEFQPLLRPGHWRSLLDFNGWPGLWLPLVVPLGLVALGRRAPHTALAFAVWTLALLPLALLRTRFATPFTPAFAVCAALALLALCDGLRRLSFPARPGLVAAGVALAVLAADPATRAALRLRPARPPTDIESVTLALGAVPDGGATRGVLARWSHGHTVLRLAGRPVLTAGFGPWTGAEAFEAAESFMRGDETELMALMDARRLGFVITGMTEAFPAPRDRPYDQTKPFLLDRGRVVWNAPYFKARPLTPLIVGGSGRPDLDIPHVAHLMPRFASERGAPGMGFPLQSLWLYERVAGARLRGRATARALVTAETPLVVHGAPSTWVAWTRADADGAFELIVPLPTGLENAALRSSARSRIGVDGRLIAELPIPEHAVRSGTVIDVGPAAAPRTLTGARPR